MIINLFNNTRDTYPKPVELTWEELCQKLTTFSTTTNKEGPCWSPVEYSKQQRSNKNISRVTTAVFDLDNMTPLSLVGLEVALRKENLSYVLHSSFSYTHKTPKCRLVIQLSRAVAASEWKAVRQDLVTLFSLPVDESTRDLARLYYLPMAKPEAETYSYINTGTPYLIPNGITQAALVETKLPCFENIPALLADLNRDKLLTVKTENKDLARRIHAGEPLALENRDATMLKAAGILAFLYPDSPDSALEELITPSLKAMPSDNDFDWELGKFREKLTRARARQLDVVKEQAELAGFFGGTERYPAEQVQNWADKQQTDIRGMNKRWIIQADKSFYVFVDGKYKQPVSYGVLMISLPRDLARAPISLYKTDGKGNAKELTVDELLRNYATAARKVNASLTLNESYYDEETETFHEAVCPLRHFEPVQHADVEHWLSLLGGSEYAELFDWLACVTKLNRQSAAIFLEGDSGSGKGLLASAIAKLWRPGPPTEFESIVGDWTEGIAQCPFIFIDEGFPRRFTYSINDELRRLTGSQELVLRRKYLTNAPIKGAVRLMLAANNNKILSSFEEMSEEDRAALTQRLIYVKVRGGGARNYLEQLSLSEKEHWCQQKIPEYITWLGQNRQVKEGKRFLVEGKGTHMHDKLFINSGLTPALYEVIVGFLNEQYGVGKEFQDSYAKLFRVHNGEILVTTKFFRDEQIWDKYAMGEKFPTGPQLHRALTNIRSRVETLDGTPFSVLNRVLLDTWAEEYNSADWAAAKEKLGL